jgi:hypothetical protein
LRGLKVLLTSLTMLLVICAPALAQSAPAASQYRTNTCPKGIEGGPQQDQVNASAGDAACATADSTGQGTDAVNDALGGTSSASASAPAEGSASTEGSASAESSASSESSDEAGNEKDAASTDGEAGGDDRALASLEELPETGGAPLMVLGSGLALTTLGLMTRKVVGR